MSLTDNRPMPLFDAAEAKREGVTRRPVAAMCVSCRVPLFSELRLDTDVDGRRCDSCGEMLCNLVFQCRCKDGPVYAVPPDGNCEYCDSPLVSSVDSESLLKLRELQARIGERRKQDGIARATENNADLVAFAKKLAVTVAESRPDRCISMDDVQAALVAEGISDRALGNSAAGVFGTKQWQLTGRTVKSQRPHSHGNRLNVWRLK